MKFIEKQFKQILLTTVFLPGVVTAMSQVPHKPIAHKTIVAKHVSKQLKDFMQLAAEANVVFTFPAGLKEIPVINNENFSYDYAMELPGRDFEVWFQVRSQKQDWIDYERFKDDPNKQLPSPDSSYNTIGSAQASAFTGDQKYLIRVIPQDILARYNANVGKTYFLNLQDLPESKHYKYALLITLQKDHIGTIVAVCFANDKGPEFFKNINKVSKCLKFKK
jgi:hypothetical protein